MPLAEYLVPRSELLVPQALLLPGIDFVVDEECGVFTNKAAIDLGRLSLDEVIATFENAYPQGLTPIMETASISFSSLTRKTVHLDEQNAGIWWYEIMEAAMAVKEASDLLLEPLQDEFEVKYSRLTVKDELFSKRILDINELAHVDSLVMNPGSLVALATHPRTTLFLRGEKQMFGLSLQDIFPNANLADDLARFLKPVDWQTHEGHAHLFSHSGTVHKKPYRPLSATTRYRAMWRAELAHRT